MCGQLLEEQATAAAECNITETGLNDFPELVQATSTTALTQHRTDNVKHMSLTHIWYTRLEREGQRGKPTARFFIYAKKILKTSVV